MLYIFLESNTISVVDWNGVACMGESFHISVRVMYTLYIYLMSFQRGLEPIPACQVVLVLVRSPLVRHIRRRGQIRRVEITENEYEKKKKNHAPSEQMIPSADLKDARSAMEGGSRMSLG